MTTVNLDITPDSSLDKVIDIANKLKADKKNAIGFVFCSITEENLEGYPANMLAFMGGDNAVCDYLINHLNLVNKEYHVNG